MVEVNPANGRNDPCAGEPLLRIRDLRFGYGNGPGFLGPITVQLSAGRMLAVVGPNGAGKSTLLRLAAGLYVPHTGAVEFESRSVHRMAGRERARRIAFLPQQSAAPSDLTARQIVLLGRLPHRQGRFFDSADDLRHAESAMATTHTAPFGDRRIGTLSSGEQQRVHLAGALAQEPRVLILDEPTSALDPFHQLSVFAVLTDLCRRAGLAIMVATHDLNLALQHADDVLVLSDGKPAAYDDVQRGLRPDILERVYHVRFSLVNDDAGGTRWIVAHRPVDA